MPAPKDPKRREEWKKKISLGNTGKLPWNTGLTAETDERVKLYAEKISKTGKGKPNKRKGYPRSEETKEKIRKKVKENYLIHPEIREIISIRAIEGYKNGRINSTKGKTWEEIYGGEQAKQMKERLSLANIKRFSDPKEREHLIKIRLIHGFPRVSSLELIIQEELKKRDYVFEPQYLFKITLIDVAFPEKKIAVYVDGDYWHNLPRCKERDERINNFLKNEGWKVLRFWEHEIKEDLDSCIRRIEEVITIGN